MQHPIVIRERKELSARQPEECIRLLEKEEWHGISCVNWQERFPYCPQAGFRAAHNGQELFIHFTVEEAVTAAIMTENNTQVCQDSCVEFFLSLDEKGYYNFEFSCIGVMMLGFRKERPQAVYAPQEVLANIGRFPSLGKSHFEEKALGEPWGLLVCIPATSLFRHGLPGWKGVKARANFYKCGDKLSRPHYLTLAPVGTEKPDFHTPQYFVPLQFL